VSFVTKDGFWIEGYDGEEFIVRDPYYVHPIVEALWQSLKKPLKQDYPGITVYLSTTNPYNHWLREFYNTELMESDYDDCQRT
jgi:hypothetical protein